MAISSACARSSKLGNSIIWACWPFYLSAFASVHGDQPHGGLGGVSSAPDGLTLASGSKDQTVRLWELSFLHDPRSIEEQLKAAEAQYHLHLVDLEL